MNAQDYMNEYRKELEKVIFELTGKARDHFLDGLTNDEFIENILIMGKEDLLWQYGRTLEYGENLTGIEAEDPYDLIYEVVTKKDPELFEDEFMAYWECAVESYKDDGLEGTPEEIRDHAAGMMLDNLGDMQGEDILELVISELSCFRRF